MSLVIVRADQFEGFLANRHLNIPWCATDTPIRHWFQVAIRSWASGGTSVVPPKPIRRSVTKRKGHNDGLWILWIVYFWIWIGRSNIQTSEKRFCKVMNQFGSGRKKLENLSQNLIHRLQSGKSYRWLSLRTEEKESAWFQSGIAAEE